jgi:hypothetical protein
LWQTATTRAKMQWPVARDFGKEAFLAFFLVQALNKNPD